MELGCIEITTELPIICSQLFGFSQPHHLIVKNLCISNLLQTLKVSKAPKWNTSNNFRQKIKYELGFGVGRGVEVKFVGVVHHAGVLSAWFL